MTCSRRSWFLRPPSSPLARAADLQYASLSRPRQALQACGPLSLFQNACTTSHFMGGDVLVVDIVVHGQGFQQRPVVSLRRAVCMQNHATDVITVLCGDNAGASLIHHHSRSDHSSIRYPLCWFSQKEPSLRIRNQIKSSLGITLQCMHMCRMLKAPLVPACASTCLI